MPGFVNDFLCGWLRPAVELRAWRRIRLGHSSRAANSNVAMSSESFCLCVVGRLHGVTRPRLAGLVTAAGGRLVRAGSRKATLVCLAHSTAPERLSRGAAPGLPARCRPAAAS